MALYDLSFSSAALNERSSSLGKEGRDWNELKCTEALISGKKKGDWSFRLRKTRMPIRVKTTGLSTHLAL